MAYPDTLDRTAQELSFWRGPSNAPLWVLFSSGTSASCCLKVCLDFADEMVVAGKPKAIMHGQLAMILQHKQVGHLNGLLSPGDRHLQITTVGWMMWCVCRCGSVFARVTDGSMG